MDPEGIDGVRMTWNIWRRTKLESTNCVVPVVHEHHHLTLRSAPLPRVFLSSKPLRNQTNLPHELHAHHTTFEYTLPNRSDRPSGAAFLFVLDTCMIDEEFGFARSSVKRAVGLLPDEALVGFVSFGTQVHVHELGFSDLAKFDLLTTELHQTVVPHIAKIGFSCVEYELIVSKDLIEPLRSHKDLDKGEAPFYEKAEKFYHGLANQLVNQGLVLDIFASVLDQVGVAKMKATVEKTGRLVVISESFGHSVFKDSFKRVFEDVNNLSVFVSSSNILTLFTQSFSVENFKSTVQRIKMQGIIGPFSYEVCSRISYPLCFLFRLPSLIMFANYWQWVDTAASTEELVPGFDQETAAVVMARLASLKMETEVEFDAQRWLDRSLTRLCSKFGDYRNNDPTSFSLNPNFSLFPQFMFNLRRSQFVQVFNNSPDETAYSRMLLNRENISNAAVMIQPSLTTYSFNSIPQPALLDVSSIASDRILLLDSYFSIVVFHGLTIAQCRTLGYQNHPEHQAFTQLLQEPQEDAQMIAHGRFPMPRLVARFLLARLNPSASYNNASEMNTGSAAIFRDDASLEVFYQHLQKLAVQS
ncbi:hypothetical protein HID58_059405 [Brassica napus]|uniref:Protein transport protein SEC23 n=1 Tax=Brassica napus TaxID=3708 RepID=A0ABQ7ZST5_BRANA|nr:hypothetical protein HID58_059405 [Brassica napus]